MNISAYPALTYAPDSGHLLPPPMRNMVCDANDLDIWLEEHPHRAEIERRLPYRIVASTGQEDRVRMIAAVRANESRFRQRPGPFEYRYEDGSPMRAIRLPVHVQHLLRMPQTELWTHRDPQDTATEQDEIILYAVDGQNQSMGYLRLSRAFTTSTADDPEHRYGVAAEMVFVLPEFRGLGVGTALSLCGGYYAAAPLNRLVQAFDTESYPIGFYPPAAKAAQKALLSGPPISTVVRADFEEILAPRVFETFVFSLGLVYDLAREQSVPWLGDFEIEADF